MANSFHRVRTKARIQGSARRNPPKAVVTPTGLSETNTAGADLFTKRALAESLDPKTYKTSYAVDTETGFIYIYTVSPQTVDSVSVRRDTKKHTITLYLEDVFDDTPDFRPTARRECDLSEGADQDGVACVVLAIRGSLIKPKGSASQREAAANKETAATKEPKTPAPTTKTAE